MGKGNGASGPIWLRLGTHVAIAQLDEFRLLQRLSVVVGELQIGRDPLCADLIDFDHLATEMI